MGTATGDWLDALPKLATAGSVLVALIGAVGALLVAAFNARRTRDLERWKSEVAAEQDRLRQVRQINAYGEPLAHAAYDLQSRLFNILRKGFSGYLSGGDNRARTYALENTAFLIAQFFCWSELARQRVRFIDLETPQRTAELRRLQDRLHSAWGTDALSPPLRVFAGEQRALGEALIVGDGDGARCMGYAAFCAAFPLGKDELIDALRTDIAALPATLVEAEPRLKKVQNALIDMLDLLDPDKRRFPPESRTKV